MADGIKAMEAIKSIREQLAWRGPTGRPMGHIVLERDEAQALYDVVLKSTGQAK